MICLLESINDFEAASEPSTSSKQDREFAFRVLGEQLASHRGCISAVGLRRELERKHNIVDARPLVVELQFFDPESSRERGIPVPSFKFRYLLRSIYSEERHIQEQKKQEDATAEEAEDASRAASAAPFEER